MKLQMIVCVLTSALMAGLANAQPADPTSGPRYEADRRDDGSRLALRTGLGFTADPTTFLMAIELPYSLTRNLTLGPLLQIGVDDRETLVAPTLNARYFLSLGQRDSSNDRDRIPAQHGPWHRLPDHGHDFDRKQHDVQRRSRGCAWREVLLLVAAADGAVQLLIAALEQQLEK